MEVLESFHMSLAYCWHKSGLEFLENEVPTLDTYKTQIVFEKSSLQESFLNFLLKNRTSDLKSQTILVLPLYTT